MDVCTTSYKHLGAETYCFVMFNTPINMSHALEQTTQSLTVGRETNNQTKNAIQKDLLARVLNQRLP